MNAVLEWLGQLYTLLSVFPPVAFLITWFIANGVWRDKRKATHVSMDVTTLFLIGSVSVMSRTIFGTPMVFWGIMLLFLIAAGLLGNLQNRLKGRIDLRKIVKTVGRLGFLVLSACYALLLCIGIGKYMIAS